jgi:hypothetical protein
MLPIRFQDVFNPSGIHTIQLKRLSERCDFHQKVPFNVIKSQNIATNREFKSTFAPVTVRNKTNKDFLTFFILNI